MNKERYEKLATLVSDAFKGTNVRIINPEYATEYLEEHPKTRPSVSPLNEAMIWAIHYRDEEYALLIRACSSRLDASYPIQRAYEDMTAEEAHNTILTFGYLNAPRMRDVMTDGRKKWVAAFGDGAPFMEAEVKTMAAAIRMLVTFHTKSDRRGGVPTYRLAKALVLLNGDMVFTALASPSAFTGAIPLYISSFAEAYETILDTIFDNPEHAWTDVKTKAAAEYIVQEYNQAPNAHYEVGSLILASAKSILDGNHITFTKVRESIDERYTKEYLVAATILYNFLFCNIDDAQIESVFLAAGVIEKMLRMPDDPLNKVIPLDKVARRIVMHGAADNFGQYRDQVRHLYQSACNTVMGNNAEALDTLALIMNVPEDLKEAWIYTDSDSSKLPDFTGVRKFSIATKLFEDKKPIQEETQPEPTPRKLKEENLQFRYDITASDEDDDPEEPDTGVHPTKADIIRDVIGVASAYTLWGISAAPRYVLQSAVGVAEGIGIIKGAKFIRRKSIPHKILGSAMVLGSSVLGTWAHEAIAWASTSDEHEGDAYMARIHLENTLEAYKAAKSE